VSAPISSVVLQADAATANVVRISLRLQLLRIRLEGADAQADLATSRLRSVFVALQFAHARLAQHWSSVLAAMFVRTVCRFD
jgi:hypothetical protein